MDKQEARASVAKAFGLGAIVQNTKDLPGAKQGVEVAAVKPSPETATKDFKKCADPVGTLVNQVRELVAAQNAAIDSDKPLPQNSINAELAQTVIDMKDQIKDPEILKMINDIENRPEAYNLKSTYWGMGDLETKGDKIWQMAPEEHAAKLPGCD